MNEKQLDADLRKLGYDPEEVGQKGSKLAMKFMAESYEKRISELEASLTETSAAFEGALNHIDFSKRFPEAIGNHGPEWEAVLARAKGLLNK